MRQEIDELADPERQKCPIGCGDLVSDLDIDDLAKGIDAENAENCDINAVLCLANVAVHDGEYDIRHTNQQCSDHEPKTQVCVVDHVRASILYCIVHHLH